MNEHISKPIESELLYKAILKHLPDSKRHKTKKKILDKNKTEKFEFKYINTQKLLDEISFNIPLFETILQRFLDDYKNYREKIIDFREENNLEKLKDYFHKFKSTSGTIKSIELFPLVNEYYELLQKEEQNYEYLEKIALANDNVILELNNFFESRKSKLEKNNTPIPLELDKKLLHDFEDLINALETKNFNKIKIAFSQIDNSKLNEKDKEIYEHISSLIKNYKFNDALRILER